MNANEASKAVLDAAMKVHSVLGPGLLDGLGLLLNFNTIHLKDGIMRVINS